MMDGIVKGSRLRRRWARLAALLLAVAVTVVSLAACRGGQTVTSGDLSKRGDYYQHNRKLWEAVREYGRAVELDPQNAELRLEYADLLVETGAYRDAEKHYRIVLRDQPDNAWAVNNLSWLYTLTEKRLEWAEEAMRPLAAKDSPHRHSYLDTLGMVYYKRRRYREAQAAFQEAADLCRQGVVMSTSEECGRISQHLAMAKKYTE